MEVETPAAVETPAPPVEAPALESNPPPATSLSDHADKFGPDATAPATDGEAAPVIDTRDGKTGRFKPSRHRAASQKAGPADAPRIAELTKKTRTVEQERDALRAEKDALKAEYDRFKAERETAPTNGSRQDIAPERQDAPQAPAATTTTAFPEPEPNWDEFAVTPEALASKDAYGAFLRLQARWDARKDAFEERQKTESIQSEQKAEAAFNQIFSTYQTRVNSFMKDHPDFDQVIAAAPKVKLTPLLNAAILTDDNGPALVYALAQHPDWQYEMLVHTHGKPVDDDLVASVQRLLNSRVQAASTGSVASPLPPPVVPKPPNPVRTGPMTTGVESPASEAGSIAAHRKSLGLSSRRR